MFAPMFLVEKHISIRDVINPPEPISWPAIIRLFFIIFCIVSKTLTKYFESFIVGVLFPILPIIWEKAEPPNLKSSEDRFM